MIALPPLEAEPTTFEELYARHERDVLRYAPEAWHVRYVGRDVAAEVHASGLPLRAWLWPRSVEP